MRRSRSAKHAGSPLYIRHIGNRRALTNDPLVAKVQILEGSIIVKRLAKRVYRNIKSQPGPVFVKRIIFEISNGADRQHYPILLRQNTAHSDAGVGGKSYGNSRVGKIDENGRVRQQHALFIDVRGVSRIVFIALVKISEIVNLDDGVDQVAVGAGACVPLYVHSGSKSGVVTGFACAINNRPPVCDFKRSGHNCASRRCSERFAVDSQAVFPTRFESLRLQQYIIIPRAPQEIIDSKGFRRMDSRIGNGNDAAVGAGKFNLCVADVGVGIAVAFCLVKRKRAADFELLRLRLIVENAKNG